MLLEDDSFVVIVEEMNDEEMGGDRVRRAAIISLYFAKTDPSAGRVDGPSLGIKAAGVRGVQVGEGKAAVVEVEAAPIRVYGDKFEVFADNWSGPTPRLAISEFRIEPTRGPSRSVIAGRSPCP